MAHAARDHRPARPGRYSSGDEHPVTALVAVIAMVVAVLAIALLGAMLLGGGVSSPDLG